MKTLLRNVLFVVMLASIAGCSSSSDPGPLEGTWRAVETMPLTVTFRDGETEVLGLIEKVSYEQYGEDVRVTALSGFGEGMAVRYTMLDEDTLTGPFGTMHRIR